MKILNFEDGSLKHAAICREIQSSLKVQIDWVRNAADGLVKLDEALGKGEPYDLIITDMHYPMAPGERSDREAGEKLLEIVKQRYEGLPVIICSSHNMQYPDAYGCVWFSEISDWERELVSMLKKLEKRNSPQ